MAQKNFQPLTKVLLGIEGDVSDRPLKDDPGGLTNKGVTQGVYDKWRRREGLAQRSVREITTQEMVAIAKVNYWTPARCDELPSGVDWAVFDFAFNSGPAQAVKELQRTLGLKADGIVGLNTLDALEDADPVAVINGICDRRLAFMKTLDNWNANKNGWPKRVRHVRQSAIALVVNEEPVEVPIELTSAPLAKAPPPAPVPVKKSTTIWSSIVAGVGGAVMWIKSILEDLPDFAKSAMSGISMFVDDSPLAQAVANGIGVLGTLGVVYVTYSLIRKKREEQADAG